MANNYFDICTSDTLQHVTGKLFNDKLEIMPVAPNDFPGYFKQLKRVFGSSVYPTYANKQDVIDQLWELCTELTKGHSTYTKNLDAF